jgi:hypothetical protein
MVVRRYRGTDPVEERRASLKVPKGDGLKLPRGMWDDIKGFKPVGT